MGCGDGPESPDAPISTGATTTTTSAGEGQPDSGLKPAEPLEPPPCPSAATNCEVASGTVLYVERVDPDGDGDAHFVLASRQGITAPGVSVIDVRPELRPSPLPGRGDQLAASGPVYEGSFGQRQIQADAVVAEPE